MTTFVSIETLAVSAARQRREFLPAAINELAESIVTNGLLQAPVARFADGKVTLVAGERRLRAMSDLHELGRAFTYNGEAVPPGMIPCTSLGDLTDLQAWEAELEENIRRVDLTWQERAQATAQLMELRRLQAEEEERPMPRVVDIARELDRVAPSTPDGMAGGPATETRNELIVSRFLHDKDVAAAPSLKEAVKILKKREERERQSELAASVGLTFTSASHRLEHANCIEWMSAAPPAQFDIILTDPPYGMGADQFGTSGVGVSAAAHFYDDSYEMWANVMDYFAMQSFRLAKLSAHLYAFCDFDRFHEFKAKLTRAGWKVHRTPLIWSNPDGFRAPWPEQGCQRKYELILYAVKGDRKVISLKGDVLEYRKDASVGHPAQKPVPLLIDLLRRSARPGDVVLDPFMGSGSTVEACHTLRLPCTGIEQDASAYGIAVERVRELGEMERTLL